jgi:hypothetical protein
MESTFSADIAEYAVTRLGEPVEFITIGNMGWWDNDDDGTGKEIPAEKKGVAMSWEAAREYLDYRYSTGYGGVDCHAIYAWTANHVILVVQYDGSTRLVSVPRNPTNVMPEIPGG